MKCACAAVPELRDVVGASRVDDYLRAMQESAPNSADALRDSYKALMSAPAELLDHSLRTLVTRLEAIPRMSPLLAPYNSPSILLQ